MKPLTEREEYVMNYFWDRGALSVRRLLNFMMSRVQVEPRLQPL